jgi:dipeptidyl aminopeptidase/acylaminoacyl peptidase
MIGLAAVSAPAFSQSDMAAAFGAREGIEDISLSPDGKQIAFLAPGTGQSSALFVVPVDKSTPPRRVTGASGTPERLRYCWWVSNTRLLCSIYVIQKAAGYVVDATRLVAVDAAGGNIKLVSKRDNENAFYYSTYGGNLVDLLPGQDGAVLVARAYVPQQSIGSLITKEAQGLGVDRIDTASLSTKVVVPVQRMGSGFISDGLGNVRIMSQYTLSGNYQGAKYKYLYRAPTGGNWSSLSEYDSQTREGFRPVAVDPTENVAFGFQKLDGRQALYKIALVGSLQKTLVLARPDVDVDSVVRIGRKQRVVGVSYSTDRRHVSYFDPAIAKIVAALGKALPQTPSIAIVDASEDENRLLIRADNDNDPGRYYLFDRTAKTLDALILSRPELAETNLATVRAVTVKASDGTMIPAYLTLPPGSTGKGLPAIVMPHGGPSARDEWGFDWYAQFYASRGFAVLQPNYRGSDGYGDNWYRENGFRGWRTAIGDVVDSGKWLVSQGIADPAKLAIVGWSYGGYAALQSSAVSPGVYKAIVAVAPVTDLGMLKAEYDGAGNQYLARAFIGSGADIIEAGSPARNAAKISVPVMMFHGEVDGNVGVAQSRAMEAKLRDAGKSVKLVTYPALDHQLPDSAARADMLRQSDAFLRTTMGIK